MVLNAKNGFKLHIQITGSKMEQWGTTARDIANCAQ
jgi:hypothetical protein